MSAQCFEIEEITHLICTQFRDKYSGPTPEMGWSRYYEMNRKALVALSRVSKKVSGVALAILWESQHDLNPLVKVMSPSIWTLYRERQFSQITAKISGEIGQQDWSRFTFYARFVKYLRLEIGSDNLYTLEKLMTYSENPTIFPRLKQITLQIDDEIVTEQLPPPRFVKLFSNITRILSIDIQFRTDKKETEWLIQLLKLISITCDRIHRLQLTLPYTWDIPENLKEAIQDFLLAHAEIRVLEELPPGSLTPLGLQILGQMPDLWDWTISQPPQLSHPLQKQSYFQNLQRLTVNTADNSVVDVVDCIARDPRNLNSVHITWSSAFSDVTNKDSSRLVESLSGFPALQSLNLSFEEPEYMDDEDQDGSFDSDLTMVQSSLAPLYKLNNLRNLDLRSPSLCFLDVLWLSRIPSTFPLLKSLSLRHEERTSTSGITLPGLIPLLKCPHLSRIDISLKCLPFSVGLLSGGWNKTIKSITLHDNSLEGDCASLIYCLLIMFPAAESITFVPASYEGEDEASRNALLMNQIFRNFRGKPGL